MTRRSMWLLLGMLGWAAGSRMGQDPFVFRDVGNEAGLYPHVAGIAGHGALWGDVDGDGWADLYVGTFGGHPYGSKPNQFFRNVQGKFQLDAQEHLRVLGRANGGVMADFDNDGDLDLYASNHAIAGKPGETAHYSTPNKLFRNDGAGKFTDVSQQCGVCPEGIAARSVAVLDYDGDGLLDMVVAECFFQGGMSRSRLYRNVGGLKFENVTAVAGLPELVTGFGTAAGDLTGDGWPEIYLAGRHHGDRLFINDGRGKYRELPKSQGDFAWAFTKDGDDTSCGVCFGDVNRDGRIDVLLGSHFSRPWFTGGVPVRLFMHRGMVDGLPKFEEVTQSAGLVPLPLKSPHVEIQDFDNDGWPDIYASIVKFAGGQPHPVIFKNLGQGGEPRFREGALAVNDFPTEEDRTLGDVGKFFDKMEREQKIVYTAPGPSCDYDRDGRLDLFLPNWWVNSRSLLLKNETPSGNWLQVAVVGKEGVNRQAIGSSIRIYPAGKIGQADALLGIKEIASGYGYASGQEAIAHLGLGTADACDVEVVLPHGKGRLEQRGVKANQRVTVQSK